MERIVRAATRGLHGSRSIGLALLLGAALALVGCSDGPCDDLDAAHCLLPFPNDAFTRFDPTSPTGRRVALDPEGMPRNDPEVLGGVRIDPEEWNRNDGFSPVSPILTRVRGLDLPRTWGIQDREHRGSPNEPGYFDYRDHITDIALYERPDAPIVLLNADTGERHPFWSELDQHPDATDERRLLFLRPARSLEPGARYIVALRRLRNAEGERLPAPESFRLYRDRDPLLRLLWRQGLASFRRFLRMESIFATLRAAGMARHDLYLAWDFTVASQESISGRLLHMRDVAFDRLGDHDLADGVVQGRAPSFTVEDAEVMTDGRFQRFRRVRGEVTVPDFTVLPDPSSADGPPPIGTRLYYDPSDGRDPRYGDGLPDVNPDTRTTTFSYTCDVPLDVGPSYPVLFGHGLLGSQQEISDADYPRRYGFAACGADFWGLSSGDLLNTAIILGELGKFPGLPDRSQQGLLNFMVLGRAMVHPQGFASHPCFRQNVDCEGAGEPLLRTADGRTTPLFYDGDSQGGVMGAALVAVSPDVQRAILGVPGIGYSTMLPRSDRWANTYSFLNHSAYPDPIVRKLNLALVQMLWDRSEGAGYAHRITRDPLPGAPRKEVMVQAAFSDHGLPNVSTEVMARTLGAPIMLPGLPEGRHWERTPYYTGTATYPYRGSAMVYWDGGNAPPPNGNRPPTDEPDPHGDPRDEPAAGWQEAHFLLTGEMLDVCEGRDYLTVDPEELPDFDDLWCVPPDRAPGEFVPVPR